ncbi:TPA: hypothetical protein QCU33_005423 [Bacillus cereus]|nr:hypothetical protein [Bacillus cereus]
MRDIVCKELISFNSNVEAYQFAEGAAGGLRNYLYQNRNKGYIWKDAFPVLGFMSKGMFRKRINSKRSIVPT